MRPFGYERTYPNWISLEGVRGNEHFPTASHNVTLPFARNIGGPLDYTICYGQSRDQTTNVHQMAMAAVFYQPLNFQYWYDSPSKFANTSNWPGLPWFDAIPTTWDESHALAGSIGQYAAVAPPPRRHLVPRSDDQRDVPDPVTPADVPGRRAIHRDRPRRRHPGHQPVPDAGRGQHPDGHLGHHAERGDGSRGRPGNHPQAELTRRTRIQPVPSPTLSIRHARPAAASIRSYLLSIDEPAPLEATRTSDPPSAEDSQDGPHSWQPSASPPPRW